MTAGEADAFYKSKIAGTALGSPHTFAGNQAPRKGLAQRQRAELTEDPKLFADAPTFRQKLLELCDECSDHDEHEFEYALVALRREFGMVMDDDELERACLMAANERDDAAAAKVHENA